MPAACSVTSNRCGTVPPSLTLPAQKTCGIAASYSTIFSFSFAFLAAMAMALWIATSFEEPWQSIQIPSYFLPMSSPLAFLARMVPIPTPSAITACVGELSVKK